MPINELLPKEEGYEYPGDMSFFPFRRKEWQGIPFAAPQGGELELTIPGFARTMLNDLWLAFTSPGRAAAGEFKQNELEEVGLRAGSGLAMGGSPIRAPANSLGIFAGRRAQSANLESLGKAMGLESRLMSQVGGPLGSTREGVRQHIFEETGWFRDVDNKWKFEIPDTEARLRVENLSPNKFDKEIVGVPFMAKAPMKLKDVLDHPALFEAYPDLADVEVGHPGLVFGLKGAYSHEQDKIFLTGQKPQDMASTALHETQHAIQNREKFAKGGNPEEFLPAGFNEKMKLAQQVYDNVASQVRAYGVNEYSLISAMESRRMKQKLWPHQQEALDRVPEEIAETLMTAEDSIRPLRQVQSEAYTTYKNLAGEVEARNVQERFEHPTSALPWRTQGYTSEEEQIVRYSHPGSAKSETFKTNPMKIADAHEEEVMSLFTQALQGLAKKRGRELTPEETEELKKTFFSTGSPIPLDLESIEYDPFDLEEVSGDPFKVEENK